MPDAASRSVARRLEVQDAATGRATSAEHVTEALTPSTPALGADDDWLTGAACPIDAGEDCEACQ